MAGADYARFSWVLVAVSRALRWVMSTLMVFTLNPRVFTKATKDLIVVFQFHIVGLHA